MPYYPPASTGSGSNTPADNVFRIQDNGDATKQIAFEASTVATGTTRTATMPNADGTLTLLGNASTGSGNVVLDTSPTIVTPTVASLTNMNHDHSATGATGGLIALASQIPAFNKTTYSYEYDDFYGPTGSMKLGWAPTNGTSSKQNISGHPGVIRRDSSSTINTIAYMSLSEIFDPAATFDMTWIVKVNQFDVNTIVRFGLMDTPNTTPPTNGYFFERAAADSNWFGNTRVASVDHRTDSTVASAVAWVRLRLRRTSSTVIAFSIDGAADFTVTTTNPSANLSPSCHISNTAAASKTMDLDYYEMLVSGLSR